ncbi:hypothetical protein [Rugamonas apoptosis]|uniref:Uncharacterized protein n=1 Tax=Rugamonas apoptosis TaxID=2758570 RepID=A0A7W2IMS5_9BURK|nr:hypothetical protein [Rugamonas apoptosis]MBA5689807.1 hypothetical protein [Rugamonas apoptosis]
MNKIKSFKDFFNDGILCFVYILFLTAGFSPVASAEVDYFRNCPIKKGDSILTVKEHYKINYEPQMYEKATPGGTYYNYHLTEYGIYIFLDASKNVLSLRFDAPFSGKIDGVSVGDTKENVVKLKGEPLKQFEGLPDTEVIEGRKKRALLIIENLPDPASKDQVRKAFSEIEAIRALPLPFETAWMFKGNERGFLRYDFGSISSKVESILSDRGN